MAGISVVGRHPTLEPAALTRLVWTVTALLALVSCSDFGDVLPDTAPETTTRTAAHSPFRERLTEDGVVTTEELSSAYDAFVVCLEDGGGQGRFSYDLESNGPGLALEFSLPTDSSSGTQEAIYERCHSTYVGDLESLYVDPLPNRIRIERIHENTRECVAEFVPGFADTPLDEFPDAAFELRNDYLETDGSDSPVVACVDTNGVGWESFGD